MGANTIVQRSILHSTKPAAATQLGTAADDKTNSIKSVRQKSFEPVRRVATFLDLFQGDMPGSLKLFDSTILIGWFYIDSAGLSNNEVCVR